MDLVEFVNWDKELFKNELHDLNQNNEIDIYFNDILCNNIEIFFKWILENKKFDINFYKKEDIDLILQKKIKLFFTRYHNEFLELNITFIEFSQKEICDLISEELFFLYCNKNNIEFEKTKELIKKEDEKLSIFSEKLEKYDEFKQIKNFYESKNRYMYFNFPIEKDLDRFVFYFLINTENDKNDIIELFKNLKLHSEIISVLKNIDVCENGSLYAIGFNYSNNELVRTTLYSRFNVFSSKLDNEIFLKKHFNLKYNSDKLFVKDWGIDVFNQTNKKIIKIYFKENKFYKNDIDSKLINILNNKFCVACFKFENSKLIDEKFEFSNKLFSESECDTLEELGVMDKKSKLFSVYFDSNGKLKNCVKYNI